MGLLMIGNGTNLADAIFDLLGVIALIAAIAYLSMALLGFLLLEIFKPPER
jgi:hypothetical protein